MKRKHEEALRADVDISKDTVIKELTKELGTLKNPHFQGPIDQFASPINHEVSMAANTRQQSFHDVNQKNCVVICKKNCISL